MAEIRWTSEAETWLKEIHDYIAIDNPYAATRILEGIFEKVQALQDYPDIGYLYRSSIEDEIRILLYGHYRIAYHTRERSDIIYILGVFHGAIDINRYI